MDDVSVVIVVRGPDRLFRDHAPGLVVLEELHDDGLGCEIALNQRANIFAFSPVPFPLVQPVVIVRRPFGASVPLAGGRLISSPLKNNHTNYAKRF